MTTPDEAKAIVRRWNDEGWSGGKYDLVYELIAPTTTVHGAGGQAVGMGPEGFRDLIQTWREAFPDGYMTVDDLIVETDVVAIRNTWHGTHTGKDFYGIPASGAWVDVTSIGLDRVKDGKVVEGWGELDMVGMMQKLGALPLVGPGAVAAGKSSEWGPSTGVTGPSTTSPEENKDILARFVQALDAGDEATLSEVVDVERFVDHNPVWGTEGWAGVVGTAAMLRAAMPDLEVRPERDIAVGEGDQVCLHSVITGTHTGADLFGAPASGKQVAWTHSDFARIVAGKIVERWVSADTLTLFQQTGVVGGGS